MSLVYSYNPRKNGNLYNCQFLVEKCDDLVKIHSKNGVPMTFNLTDVQLRSVIDLLDQGDDAVLFLVNLLAERKHDLNQVKEFLSSVID